MYILKIRRFWRVLSEESKKGKLPVCGKKSVLAERTGNIHGPVSMLWSEIIVRRKALSKCCVSIMILPLWKRLNRNWLSPVIKRKNWTVWNQLFWLIWVTKSVLRWMRLSAFPACWQKPKARKNVRTISRLYRIIMTFSCDWYLTFSILRR